MWAGKVHLQTLSNIYDGSFQPVLPIFEKDSTTDAWKSYEYVFEYNFQKQTWKTNDTKKRNRISFNKIQWHWSLSIPLENGLHQVFWFENKQTQKQELIENQKRELKAQSWKQKFQCSIYTSFRIQIWITLQSGFSFFYCLQTNTFFILFHLKRSTLLLLSNFHPVETLKAH